MEMIAGGFDVIIAGGGVAGLSTAALLARRGYSVAVFEKKKYPSHKVCGEYLSLETEPFFEHLGINLRSTGAKEITTLDLVVSSGRTFSSALPLGALGISRYRLDHLLMKAAQKAGASIFTQNAVRDVVIEEGRYQVKTERGIFSADVFIGAHGKRDVLDRSLHRVFLKKRTGYMAVKYHLLSGFPDSKIGLYTFPGGYAGMVNVEDGRTCFCYLMKRDNMKGYRSISEMENSVLFRNTALKDIVSGSSHLYDQPLVINEITFAHKGLTENGLFYTGDSSAMIAPVCGNGMAMAIGGAILLSNAVEGLLNGDRKACVSYQELWKKQFSGRVRFGKLLQNILLREQLCDRVIPLLNFMQPLSGKLISMSHGRPFSPVTSL